MRGLKTIRIFQSAPYRAVGTDVDSPHQAKLRRISHLFEPLETRLPDLT